MKDLLQHFCVLLDGNEYGQARRVLDAYVDDGGNEVNVAGCYIDLGLRMGDKELAERGIGIYERLLARNASLSDKQLQGFYYDIGNGYQGLLEQVKRGKGGGYRAFIDNTYLMKAMRAYQSAYEHGADTPELHVNYANSLDCQGRNVEAIGYYDRALRKNDNHGMAYGNKAICLIQLARISGEYQQAQYIYAYQLLNNAIKNQQSVLDIGGQIALERFQTMKKEIEKLFEGRQDLLKETLRHPPFDTSDLSDKLQGLYDFAGKQDLFLNLHVQDKRHQAALFDHVFISIVTPVGDTQTFHEFADWINEMKESYMTARYLLFESGRITEDKTHISKLTVITNPLDYSTKTLYTGLRKTAIKEAFGVLDKIACFLNEYLAMNISNIKSISWDKIWFKQLQRVDFDDCFQQPSVFHEVLEDLENYTLFGLFSLFSDIEKSGLRDLRNALTHRKVSVRLEGITDTEDAVDAETLEEKAIQLLQFTKHAIIYLINFVNCQEDREDGSGRMYVITDQFI